MKTEALERTKRDILRDKIFNNRKHKRKTIEIFGEKVEVRQPSLGELMDAREEKEAKRMAARMIVSYCYVPGTDDRVFEETDIDVILAMPFGDELIAIQNAIGDLTDVDIKEQEKN